MRIKEISLSNFKTFEKQSLKLNNFNILIGANASGKSNFVQLFRFLKNIANSGLDNAVSMQGGAEYLRNIAIGSKEKFSLKIVSDLKSRFMLGFSIGFETNEITYELIINFNGRKKGFEILRDNIIFKGDVVKIKEEEGLKLGQGEVSIEYIKKERKVKCNISVPKNVELKKEDVFFDKFLKQYFSENPPNTILEGAIPFFPSMKEYFNGISICDFDPKLPKKAVAITGKTELEEDGSNLAITLKNILETKNKRRKLFNLVNDLLPFVKEFDIEKIVDKSMHFKAQETYYGGAFLPASFLSDGTINVTALIVALFIDERPLVIIEEPEKNIHPYLISKLVGLIKEASKKKQIIITTHNPEVVKHAGIENILLVSRNNNGFTQISKPVDNEDVKIFMNNNLGVEDLYVQNLLGA